MLADSVRNARDIVVDALSHDDGVQRPGVKAITLLSKGNTRGRIRSVPRSASLGIPFKQSVLGSRVFVQSLLQSW